MIFVQPPLPGLLPMWPVNAFLPAPKKASQKEKVQGYFHVIFCRQYFYKVTEMLFSAFNLATFCYACCYFL
jgi:hypothetical protein